MVHHRKYKFCSMIFFLTSFTLLPFTQFLILGIPYLEISGNTPDYRLKIATGTLTREYSPITLNQENSPELWSKLDNLHVDNMRIAYFDGNDWILVPFQLDEKGYVRTLVYIPGFQISLNLDVDDPLNDADLCNYGRYQAIKRYLGKDIDAQPGYEYKEQTKYECELGFWDAINAENWDNDDPLKPLDNPQKDYVNDLPQKPHRIDYDDELYFYAYDGNKVAIENWWNEEKYPYRFEIEIFDAVDSGQAWIYLYYNQDESIPVNIQNFFIPTDGPHAGVDYVDWDNSSLTASGLNYTCSYDMNNVDLSSVNINSIPIINEFDKQYISTGFSGGVNYTVSILGHSTTISYNIDTNAEIWQEGTWNGDYFDEIKSYIGYGITMDLDLPGIEDFPGQDTIDNNAHDYNGYHDNKARGDLTDDSKSFLFGIYEYCKADSADHDGNNTEHVPFARGKIDDSNINGEAAIDGPCRVIINKYNIRVTGFYIDDIIEWEEFYLVSNMESWFSASMMGDFKTELSMNFTFGENDLEFEYQIFVHYVYMAGQKFSSEFIDESNSYVMFGQAPTGEDGLPNLTQCYDGNGKIWPLICYPDEEQGLDEYLIDDGPNPGQYNNELINPSSEDNPLSDWVYAHHPSFGGMLTYIPYQEFKALFNEGSIGNADLSVYWADNDNFTEFSIYGNDADINGATKPFEKIVLFANLDKGSDVLTDLNCKREYARMKMKLSENLIISLQKPVSNNTQPGPQNFLFLIVIIGGGIVIAITVIFTIGRLRAKKKR